MVTPVSAKNPKAASQPADANYVENPTKHVVDVAKIGLVTTGAALVAYFAYRLARRKDDRSNFLAAALKFRSVFALDIAYLESGRWSGIALMDSLREAYRDRHAAAIAEFEIHVAGKRLAAFRDDWNRYRYGEKEDGSAASPDDVELSHDEFLLLCYAGPGQSWETHISLSGTTKALHRIRKLMEHGSE